MTTVAAIADLPPPATQWTDWPMAWDAAGAPSAMDASALPDKPAGARGPVTVRGDHFYSGNQRIRFWGVNFAFSACFPAHEQADAVAQRLSRFGINAVRIHHADMQPFPNGIWADRACETISPEALDRLDYLVAALKRQGIYVDLNLHVSRTWSKAHNWENADKLPETFDKLIDVFHPELNAANKQYARELLGHVNAYTNTRYAEEPAVCFVEINNEDTLFLWGGEGALARLPEPYARMLKALWSQWLAKRYGTTDKLKAAWSAGEMPLGENLLHGDLAKDWKVEQHETAKMTAAPADGAVKLTVTHADGTDWHLQFNAAGIKLAEGKFYTVTFVASAERPMAVGIAAAQAHAPWQNLGLSASAKLDKSEKNFSFGFTASGDDDNARLSFSVGHDLNTITLSNIQLREGGRLGLRAGEDLVKGTIASHVPGDADTKPRSADWFDFLQQTDERYFVQMREFLKNELGVRCPITGSIGLGPLGTLGQSKMDFVDAHAYWDHPEFPHRSWDMKDWRIKNQPMVDRPEGAALWGLAATRVKGKPFTVTEYNHAAPNEWQAECMPMIASYAALQDWDGVFLFAYSHNDQFDKGRMSGFFDVEGNPLKMPFMPLASRIFLGGSIKPLEGERVVAADHNEMLRTGSQFYDQAWPWARSHNVKWSDALRRRLAIDFNFNRRTTPESWAPDENRVDWTAAAGAGTGRYRVIDEKAVIFAGFTSAEPIELGDLLIERCETPFVSLMLTGADAAKPLASADRLLLAVVGRGQNTGMQWDEARKSVSDHWGTAPAQIEVAKAKITVRGKWRLYPLGADGARAMEIAAIAQDGATGFEIGSPATVWYEMVREP